MRGCLDGGCPRGRHYPDIKSPHLWNKGAFVTSKGEEGRCACGEIWPCPDSAEPGSSYDTGPGECRSTHAELNAILQSSWAERQGATLYVNTEPCVGCLKIIACSGIIRVIWPGGKLDFPFLSCYTPS